MSEKNLKEIRLSGKFSDFYGKLSKGHMDEDELFGTVSMEDIVDDHPGFVKQRILSKNPEGTGFPLLPVTTENADRFQSVISPDLLEELGKPGNYGFGVVRREKGKNIPTGGILFSVKDLEGEVFVKIVWLYVEPDFRRRGIAGELMSELMDFITEEEGVILQCDILPEEGLDTLGPFFEQTGFLFSAIYTPYFREKATFWKEVAEKKIKNENIEKTGSLSVRKLPSGLFSLDSIEGADNMSLGEFALLVKEMAEEAVWEDGKKTEILFRASTEDEAELFGSLFPDYGLALCARAFLLPRVESIDGIMMAISNEANADGGGAESLMEVYNDVSIIVIRLNGLRYLLGGLGYQTETRLHDGELPYIRLFTENDRDIRIEVKTEADEESYILYTIGKVKASEEWEDSVLSGESEKDPVKRVELLRKKIGVWDEKCDLINIDYDIKRHEFVCMSAIPVESGLPKRELFGDYLNRFLFEMEGFAGDRGL